MYTFPTFFSECRDQDRDRYWNVPYPLSAAAPPCPAPHSVYTSLLFAALLSSSSYPSIVIKVSGMNNPWRCLHDPIVCYRRRRRIVRQNACRSKASIETRTIQGRVDWVKRWGRKFHCIDQRVKNQAGQRISAGPNRRTHRRILAGLEGRTLRMQGFGGRGQ